MQKHPVDPPYKVGYVGASVYTIICKKCHTSIQQDDLRLAVMNETPMTDLTGYKAPTWYHFQCFFTIHQPKSVTEFECFHLLRKQDQTKIELEILRAAGTRISRATNVNGPMIPMNIPSSTYPAHRPPPVQPASTSTATINGTVNSVVNNPSSSASNHANCLSNFPSSIPTYARSATTLPKTNLAYQLPTVGSTFPPNVVTLLPTTSQLPPTCTVALNNPAAVVNSSAALLPSTSQPPPLSTVVVSSPAVVGSSSAVSGIMKSSQAPNVPYIRVIPTASLQNIPTNPAYGSAHTQSLLRNAARLSAALAKRKVMIMNNGRPSVIAPGITPLSSRGAPAALPTVSSGSSVDPYSLPSSSKRRKVRNSIPSSPPDFHPAPDSSLFTYQLNTTTASTVGLQVKDGSAVDPQCQAQDTRVYRDASGNIYSAVLSQTDWESGTNVFHKLQILQSTVLGGEYRFFQSKGEIGGAGYMRYERPMDVFRAVSEFERVFFEQTGNQWRDRSTFHRVRGKKIMLDVVYKPNVIVDDNAAPSQLAGPVQKFIRLIHQFGTTTRELESIAIQTLDLEKWPLGRISGPQIQEAYQLLLRLEDCVNKDEQTDDDLRTIIRCTNEYYSLIPHHFNANKPLLLNTMARIQEETEKMDSLMMTETQYSLIDAYYEKLNATVRPLGTEEVMYEIVKSALLNTSMNRRLTIVEIFKIDRIGEDIRYSPYKTLGNRKLLWHGSRLVNFSKILAQGLCIAPAGAAISGHVFGRGIYFSDMVEKSANYCGVLGEARTGLLLLCEVALGNVQCVTRSDERIVKPQQGFDSLKANGFTIPDPQLNMILEDGIEIALGKPVTTNQSRSSISFNEYIVFNEAQIKLRYLAQVTF